MLRSGASSRRSGWPWWRRDEAPERSMRPHRREVLDTSTRSHKPDRNQGNQQADLDEGEDVLDDGTESDAQRVQHGEGDDRHDRYGLDPSVRQRHEEPKVR